MGWMAITVAGVLRLVRRLARGGMAGLAGLDRAVADTPAAAASAHRAHGLHTAAGRGHVAWPPAQRGGAPRRPLRVLRVVDAGHAPSTAGRMVISGRLADVCAELDRLAALETATA